MTRILHRVLVSASVAALWLIAVPSSALADDSKEADEPADTKDPTDFPKVTYPEPSAVAVPGVTRPPPEPRKASQYYWVDDGSRPALPYRGGEVAVPDGYRVDSHPNMGLLAAGITTTATLWTVSTIAAIALDQRDSTLEGDPNFDDAYWPMFIPVVGPFITIKTADSSGTGAAILGLNGVAQTAGIGMIIAGIAVPKVEIIPQRPITIAPVASAEMVGLDISGAF